MNETDLAVLEEILSQRKLEQDPQMGTPEYFEFFTAQEVLRDYQLDPEEIKSGIVGQSIANKSPGTDGGIDAIYLLVNGRLIRDFEQATALKNLKQNIVFDVVIIQSSLETGFTLKRLIRLKDTCENIFRIERSPDDFAESYAEDLLDNIKRFRETHRTLIAKHAPIHVHLFYVTRGDATTIAPDVEKKAKVIEKDITDVLPTISKCIFSFVGARDLIALSRKPPKITFLLNCVDSILSGRGRLALVELGEFRRMITSEKGELLEYLFESNVRDYQGDVDVNEQIRETLQNQNDKAEFWWLNNGITILATKIGGHPKEISIDEPQIVNGLQTSMEIYEHLRQLPSSEAAGRHAVIRLIESPEPELQDRIIKATNSQTKIPPQFLYATDDLQRDIEQIFRASGMHYDRRKNSWRKQSIGLDKVVGMSELAQSVAATYLQEPDHARARPSRFFKKEHYAKVFSPKVPMDLYVACAMLRKNTEQYLRTAEAETKNRNNLLFYVMTAVVCIELKTPRAKANSITSGKIRELKPSTFALALDLVRPIYEKHGGSDNAAKGSGMAAESKQLLVAKFAKKQKVTQETAN